MTTVCIDRVDFMLKFGADSDYRADLEDQQAYLDRESGEIVNATTDLWKAEMLYGLSAIEDLAESSALVKAHPDQYLEIESMSHGAHHRIMQNFLESDWTNDKERIERVCNVYYPRKSIGYWLKNVEDDKACDAYFAYRDAQITCLAEEFLRDNGVSDFVWG